MISSRFGLTEWYLLPENRQKETDTKAERATK